MRVHPWEAVVVAADLAVKHGSVEIGFMDRFNGSLSSSPARCRDPRSAEQEMLDYFDTELDFHVCQMTQIGEA